MSALSFKGRFVELILNNEKNQTIRAFRKYPIKKGETLFLYTGMRTKFCKKLKEVKCIDVCNVTITTTGVRINNRRVLKRNLESFAIADGFKSWEEMKKWWSLTHDLPFTGQLIKW